jgi:signal transduction histidine kinase
MSHELRTPLNAVIGFAELMKRQTFGPLGDAKYVEYARDISQSANHLLEIINDILDLSKAEAGKLRVREQSVDVPRAVDACLRLINERAMESELTIRNAVPDNLPRLRADPRMVKQITLNLLSNAVKFTPAGGEVRIEADVANGGGLRLSVFDNGIGIAAEDMATALSHFGQVDSTLNRKYEGTGLGLPLVKQLIELHDGTMEITSDTGSGTAATVRFPAERVDG